jgi:RecB family exonuclease
VWGTKSRGNQNKVTLPVNLAKIRYYGSGDDELRRILYVAATRARHTLLLTSHANKDSGTPNEPVKYMKEHSDEAGRVSDVLPEHTNRIQTHEADTIMLHSNIAQLWQQRHVLLQPSLQSLLQDRLAHYTLNPTQLNTFIDTQYGGPEAFFMNSILRFPHAPTPDGEYGSVVHTTLEHITLHNANKKALGIDAILRIFDSMLKRSYMDKSERDNYRQRGHRALRTYTETRRGMLASAALPEVHFRNEIIRIGEAQLNGKIDRLEIDTDNKTIRIVDYKTGTPHRSWASDVLLYKYRQQLYFYKLLVNGSKRWKGYTVLDARLEFVEPDVSGAILPPLLLHFDLNEEEELIELIQVVWQHIMHFHFPDIQSYKPTIAGIKQFVKDLRAS